MPSDDEQARVVRRARAIRAGDEPPTNTAALAFDQVLAAHTERTVRVCRRIVGDEELARELAQEALLQAWKSLPGLQSDASFTAFVSGIARNLARNARKKRREALTDDGVLEPTDPGLDALAALSRAERAALFERVSAALLPEEQEAIRLRYVDDVGQEDIGPQLGRPDLDGRALLQRCRRRLGRALQAELAALGHGPSFFRTNSG